MLLDAVIQRFEFCIELFWRTLQIALRLERIEARSPKAVMTAAFAQHWIEDEALWVAMLDDRSRTSHTYKRDVALDVLARLPGYHSAMRSAYDALRSRLTAPP